MRAMSLVCNISSHTKGASIINVFSTDKDSLLKKTDNNVPKPMFRSADEEQYEISFSHAIGRIDGSRKMFDLRL